MAAKSFINFKFDYVATPFMSTKKWSMILISLPMLFLSTLVQATVINLDGTATKSVFTTFSTGGLDFTVNSGLGYNWDSSAPNSNGTDNIIFGFGTSDILSLTKTGGGLFDLNSFDMAISFYNSQLSDNILVNGSSITITQSMQTFDVDLLGVSEVQVTASSSNSGYWVMDNIVFNATAVPEPTSLALLGLGLAVIGFSRKKKIA